LQAPWEQVLKAMKLKGTDTGVQATLTSEQLMAQAQTALREGRATGVRAAQAMMDSYSALVSGVLIGMSEGLQQGAAPAPSEGGHARSDGRPAGAGRGLRRSSRATPIATDERSAMGGSHCPGWRPGRPRWQRRSR
jgi:hypothetical protein